MKHQSDQNILCWCDSGRAYKDCHLDRHLQKPLHVNDILTIIQKQYSGAKYCFHPDAGKKCKGSIIQAHTIQRRGSLSKIAGGGKVMNFTAPDAHILKTGKTSASLIGIKEASIFTGFCGHHDDQTFKPIETQAFQFTDEHFFLLAYRAICKELYEREIWVRSMPHLRNLDRGYPIENQRLIQYWAKKLEIASGFRRDCVLHHKQYYDRLLNSRDFSELRYYAIRLGEIPDIVCSAAFCPRFDFTEILLQQPNRSRIYDVITCSIVATEAGGVIVFSWVGRSAVCERFVWSLDQYGDEELPHAIVRLAFYSFQNMYGRPAWWNNLDQASQDKLLRRREIGMTCKLQLVPDCYVDDGLRSVTWKIEARTKKMLA